MLWNSKNGAVVQRLICAIFFILFSVLYLQNYQDSILAVTQHVLSHGATHYNSIVGTVLITLVLQLVQVGVCAGTRLHGQFHALTYFPSLLLLAMLTDVSPHVDIEGYLGRWLWLLPLLIVIFVVAVWVCHQFDFLEQVPNSRCSPLQTLWLNMLLMLVMTSATSAVGCSDKVFHMRMRMESHLLAGRFAAATGVGVKEAATDSSLTMLRIWALSEQHALGERLFEYPLTGRSDAMLPNGSSVKLMMVPESRLYRHLGVVFRQKLRPAAYLAKLHEKRWATPAAHDWLLCACLLDRRLDDFVRLLPRYYKVNGSLPKHYREALTLYTHLHAHPYIVYHEAVMDADYDDYTELEARYAHSPERYAALRDSYGKTYWFYYDYLARRDS